MSNQGLPFVMLALGERGQLHRDANTVTGQIVWEQVRDTEVPLSLALYNLSVIEEA